MQFTSRQKVLISFGVLFAIMLTPLLFIGGTGSGGFIELTPANLSTDAPVTNQTELRADQQRLIQQATVEPATAYGYNPIRGLESYVVVNGTYYRVSANRTNDTAQVEKPVLVVAPTANASDAVPLTDYGHHAVELVAPSSGSNESHTVVLQPDMRGREELLPTPRYGNITWKNQTYSVRVENRTVEQPRYTVSTSVVATTKSAFTEYLLDNEVRVELTADQFTQEEREIIEQAIDDQYSEDQPFSEPYKSVLATIFGEGGERQYEVFVRYDGQLYRAELQLYAWG